MAKDPDLELRERRILVLHNRDIPYHADETAVPPQQGDEGVAHDVSRALVARGHFVSMQGISRADVGELLRQLQQDPPDLVFNLVESLSETARHEILVPSLLELLRVPYTGSSPLTLGLCARKHHTGQLLRGAGIPTPPAALLPARPQPSTADLQAVAGLGYPLRVKRADTSDQIVHSDSELLRSVESLRFGQPIVPILVEKQIVGRQLQVSLLSSEPLRTLPPHEPEPATLSPSLPRALRERIELLARASFAELEVHDYGRCDIRLGEGSKPYVVDVSPSCDLADGGGLAHAGRTFGLQYDALIEQIALSALRRSTLARRDPPAASARLAIAG